MPIGQHLLTGLASTSLQDGKLARLVDQKDTGVIQRQAIPDEIHRRSQQLVQVEDRAGRTRDFGGGLELSAALLEVGQNLPALGDVSTHAHQANDGAAIITHRHFGSPQPLLLTI